MRCRIVFLLPFLLGHVQAADRPAKPNILLLLTDDLGWQDVGCYDIDEPSPMETPNIDALAEKGVLFWQGYAPAPTCAPSRCAIMSGNHPARAQKTHVVGGAPPMPHHRTAHRMLSPWYSGRMPAGEMTLARALASHGYATGHVGKWHMAIDHKAFPQPEDQGFAWTRSDRGARSPMKPHRLTGFATSNADDPFRLDEDGFPTHQNNLDAMEFVRTHKERPFFLYYATWLVHTPIHTRSRALLEKYCKKLGLEMPTNPVGWDKEGQNNPWYCAMVEELDHYVGQLFRMLETTDDPRWPGHKLIENTYVIFTSDNGGMEGHGGPHAEIFTDNYPLDRGKISAMEGGTRVPLIITGPDIAAGVESEVMVNGLDFYPTILALTGTPHPEGKHFDGLDLSKLLRGDPTDASLVREADGRVRDTMVWHFPNSVAWESTIRIGDHKLVRNYEHSRADVPELELYHLYRTVDGKTLRGDIEESNNLAKKHPGKARAMNRRLTEMLSDMKASYPYQNPNYRHALPHKEGVCVVAGHERDGRSVTYRVTGKGNQVVRADLLYTLNGGRRYEEWFRLDDVPLEALGQGANQWVVRTELPKGTTHYFLNLVDEHSFLRSYPEPPEDGAKKKSYIATASAVK